MVAEVLGGKLLAEIETGSLEELLSDLRSFEEEGPRIKPLTFGIPRLDEILRKHGGKLEITGSEGLMLLYQIVSVIVSPPRSGTVVVVDADGRFDVTRLDCEVEDLQHVHVYFPLRGHVKETIMDVKDYLLGGEHASMSRECVGVFVNGAQGGNVMVGWRGWLKVESDMGDIPRFGIGMSAEDAMREREQRQMALDSRRWRALSEWGQYSWTDD